MMRNIEETIQKLRGFDLSSVSDAIIWETLRGLGNAAILSIVIKPGNSILRARSDREFISRKRVKEISYIKDTSLIPQYNRASLQGSSMFYGVLENRDSSFCQSVTTWEVSKLGECHAAEDEVFSEYITMGRWIVSTEIHLAAIVYNKDFCSGNTMLSEMLENYKKFISQFPDNESDYLKIAEYLAYEFSKPVKDDERYNYKISAVFSEIVREFGLDGILYPTAKWEGKAFNVAIKPDVVDNSLEFDKAIVFWNQQKKKNIMSRPYLISDSFNEKEEFVWRDPGGWTPEFMQKKILERE